MNFVSMAFVLFLLATVGLFYGLPSRWRMPILLVMSYVFYATWNIPFIALILFSTTVDYFMSQIIAGSNRPAIRRSALIFGLFINLAILVYFKYSNFLLGTYQGWISWMGYSVDTPMVLNILLPLGISFYTFEAISYMVDVYRGKEPARNWLEYNYYIMYFPHLISGPIIRFGELVPQYRNPIQLPDVGRITNGLVLILLGYLFKVLIADPVAVLVEPVFSPPHDVGVLQAYLGVLAFTVQIYFDFMGYTHIARGISLLFNIELPLNFNHPYLADNISNFWERWHITLSRWIRDYLYFPLGGSKGTLQRTVFNLMVTMLICGAWHGAGWTFILWGGYHGMLLAGYHLIKAARQKTGLTHALAGPMNHWAATAVTFTLVTLGWILFRAPDLASAGAVFTKLANGSGLVKELFSTRHLDELTGILGMLTLCFSGPWIIRLLSYLYRPLPFWLKVQLCCILAFICWLLTAEGTEPFIYFQF